MLRLSTTAYIAWSVFNDSTARAESQATRMFLLGHAPATIDDPHALALVCNALLAIDPSGRDAEPYLDRLDAVKRTSDDGRLVWWEQQGRTTFYGAGQSGSIETTALVAGVPPSGGSRLKPVLQPALDWIVRQRDARGAWHSTQATVLALKALLAGTAFDGEGERRVRLALNGVAKEIVIPADQAEVMKQLDLTEHLQPGPQSLTLTETAGGPASYQVAFRYHVPGEAPQGNGLSIRLAYDRQEVEVGDAVKATAVVKNANKDEDAPMVMVELPIPAGFALEAADFEKMMRDDNRVAKYQISPRTVLLYLRSVPAADSLALEYRLRAIMPVRITAAAARVYEYYNPAREGFSSTTDLRVGNIANDP